MIGVIAPTFDPSTPPLTRSKMAEALRDIFEARKNEVCIT